MSDQHILVIEDQEDLAALYESALRRDGYRVTKAYTGEEGVAIFQDDGADAVLLDMTLPEMNGVQTLQQIRALDTNVPVVVATGETSQETRQQCARLGVHEYLTKPVDPTELSRALRRALDDPLTATEEYEVVTLRLPTRVVKALNCIDENLENAVTKLCAEKTRAGG